MANYGSNHLLFKFGGSMGQTETSQEEEWACGLRIFIGASVLDEASKAAFLAAIQAQTKAYFTHSQTVGHGRAHLERLTAAYIGLDGRYVGGNGQPTTEFLYTSPFGRGAGTSDLPWSHAQVVTLEADIDRGRGSRGRYYLPSGMVPDLDGRWTAAAVASAATQARGFIDNINTAARAQWSPASAVSVFSPVDGSIGTVISVGVGRSPDTQRRRDNKLLEERASLELTTTLAAGAARAERTYHA